MSDLEQRFHEQWVGMVQPIEGLVVSIPVLVDAQCMQRHPPELQQRLHDLAPAGAIADLPRFLHDLLGLTPAHLVTPTGDDLTLYVPEGGQTLRPTFALRDPAADATTTPPTALIWDLPDALDLDRPETTTGPWEYPPAAKFDRLLRHTRVPIGILTNRRVVRLVYAPHGESTGAITFRIDDMLTVGGRPILDAFVMLLSATRLYGVKEEHSLPAILAESRRRQANVTNELADQVLEAIQILLRGFESAAERDGTTLLADSVARDDDHVYGGLLTTLLRLVFVLYAEDRGLLPIDHPVYAEHLSVLGLFDRLQHDHGAYPDSMSRRFGAWPRLVALFRAIYLGAAHVPGKTGDAPLRMPPRRGQLFDPERFPFLEGWGPEGGAPIVDATARAAVRVPSIDDETIYRVLERLMIFEGQRLSYRALDVEQIGSVYEALMGYHVERLEHEAVALRVKSKSSAARAWVEVDTLLAQPASRRVAWLEDELGFDKATAKKVVAAAKDADSLLALTARSEDRRARFRAPAGRLVLQPGPERRRTSSHYTPRELSAPIVRRTLEPLLAVMGDAPESARILNLKICDPAMGSGAFLVEACRFLGDELVKAWTREGKLPVGEDPVLPARRLVAQRCLYGVDKNPWAVDLAKLSLWLVTLSRDLPFTFLDHALRHGDSLVGLDFDQIRAGHWKPSKQVELAETTLREALEDAIAIRQSILDLATDPSPEAQREKERRLADAHDALIHARLLADLVIGAFFAHDKDKAREKERKMRIDAYVEWKRSGAVEIPDQLLAWQTEIRARVPVFHWMLELPEVFYAERPDPLEENQVNRAAYMDAFTGNPPFMGGGQISGAFGDAYLAWVLSAHQGSHGNADLVAYFFRRAHHLLGAHGSIGFIATNTIGQGDTRATGLQALLAHGHVIYSAETDRPWPGDASVMVSVVSTAKGRVAHTTTRRHLNVALVSVINSRLDPAPERPDPVALRANDGVCFPGSKIYGQGFILTPEERAALIAQSPQNGVIIMPYIGGEAVNTNPDQGFDRYVINFGDVSIEQARKWPALYTLVEERVRSDRERSRDNADGARRKDRWWVFERTRPELYSALAQLDRCIVTSAVSKHLMFSFQPTNRVYSHKLFVFAVGSWTALAVLQSRTHELWVRLLSSTLEDRLNYSASDSFETFPFPASDPRAVLPGLESAGRDVDEARSAYMRDTQHGLTPTYNALTDPTNQDPRIHHLRHLHESLDRAVLTAYGWSDVAVPPYCPSTPEDQAAVVAFRDEVIDRLFVLNAARAEQERRSPAPDPAAARPRKARHAKAPVPTQLELAPQSPARRRAPASTTRSKHHGGDHGDADH